MVRRRWIGDVSSVQALGKTVVGLRKDQAGGQLKAVQVPDHLDVLATHPSGGNVHFLISSVLGKSLSRKVPNCHAHGV